MFWTCGLWPLALQSLTLPLRQELNSMLYIYICITNGINYCCKRHRVRTCPGNPGKFWKPLKPLEKPWNFVLLSPGKSHTELYWKNQFAKWCILLISLQVTVEIEDFRIISKLITSFCVRNHCLVLKRCFKQFIVNVIIFIPGFKSPGKAL